MLLKLVLLSTLTLLILVPGSSSNWNKSISAAGTTAATTATAAGVADSNPVNSADSKSPKSFPTESPKSFPTESREELSARGGATGGVKEERKGIGSNDEILSRSELPSIDAMNSESAAGMWEGGEEGGAVSAVEKSPKSSNASAANASERADDDMAVVSGALSGASELRLDAEFAEGADPNALLIPSPAAAKPLASAAADDDDDADADADACVVTDIKPSPAKSSTDIKLSASPPPTPSPAAAAIPASVPESARSDEAVAKSSHSSTLAYRAGSFYS